jgi:regulator of replication initiation timing
MYPPALFAIMLIILLNGCCCSASVLVKTNTTHTFGCDGRLDECLIEDDLELEFLMNTYVSRMLKPVDIGNSNDPNSIVFQDCGAEPRGRENKDPKVSYDSCVAILKEGFHACKSQNVYDRCRKLPEAPPGQ